ncbi:glycoside hydrolase family 15 protein, partial [Actinomadura sediminis]
VLLDVRGPGGAPMRDLRRDGPVWTARAGDARIRWRGADEAAVLTGDDGVPVLTATVDLAEDETRDLVLEIAARAAPGGDLDPDALWDATERDWLAAVPSCEDTIAPRDARLAYGVLTGLTSRAGGMVAAATTGLPERADKGRNFDYRYAWIRDQCFAGLATAVHGGPPDLLRGAVAFVTDRVLDDRDALRPAYTVSGAIMPDEHGLDLPGYPGAAAVAGNGAADQFQLDAFGEALVLFAAAAEHDRADPAAARAAAVAADVIARRWPLPDAGIWETHDDLWAHSRLICAAGLRRAARVLASGPAQAREWTSLADALIAETSRTSLTPDGRWRRAPGDDRVDAALLIPPLRGALPPGDPRTAATLDAVRDHLVQEGFVYRYAVNDEPLGTAEGAFTLCGFFLALAEHRQGDAGRARATFERTRSGCATSGLFSEEYDVRQRQLRGNIPQAFVHALLLESAAGLARDPGRPPPSPPGE